MQIGQVDKAGAAPASLKAGPVFATGALDTRKASE
jgi:hypothetical protein